MALLNKFSAFAIFTLLPISESGAVTSLGRVYAFGFERGNLIRNWSFENPEDNWHGEAMAYPRFLAKQDGIVAPTGSYVGKFTSSIPAGGAPIARLHCDLFPVQPNTQYTLSLFLRSTGGTAGVRPTVSFFSSKLGDPSTIITSIPGSNYPGTTDWTLYSWTFTTPDQDCHAVLTLADVGVGQGGTFWFDDLVMEKGASASPRTGVRETIAFLNDAGQSVQSQAKVAGGGTDTYKEYIVSTDHYDDRRRLDREYAEYPLWGKPDFDPNYATNAASYNAGSNGKGTMGSIPFDRAEYWDEPGDPINKTYLRSDPWKFVPISSGAYFVMDLTVPSNPTVEPTTPIDGQYQLSWSTDVQGQIFLNWKNALGQMIQSAIQNGPVWDFTRYEYFPDGRLKKTLQPTDVPGDESHQDFREITNYNAAGEITSTYSKDRGLRKYWYNRIGNIRFSRHESQPATQYDFTEYDFLERATSFGVVNIPSLNQDIIESRAYAGTGRVEHIGMLYDNLSAFQSRTGLNPASLLPGIVLGVHGDGRLVCDYNLNPEVDLQNVGTADGIIATFYNYNQYGEATESYRYVGPIKDPSAKIHTLKFEYDYRHRVTKATLTSGLSSPTTLSVFQYLYDDLGRVSKILGLNGRFLMSFAYYDWGGLKSINLGGTGTLSSGTRIDYTYHAQDWIKEIKATNLSNGDVTFQQILGYEDKAIVNQAIPSPSPGRLDGKISQQILKFANDVNSQGPLRLTNYQYDAYNRLTVADGKKNANATPLNAFQQIILDGLTWTDTEDMDTRVEYDAQGRISSQQNGVTYGNRASFAYQGNSYRLDHVAGTLNSESSRDASASGTFIYDDRGRLIEDMSKGVTITYGWDDLPVDISVKSQGLLLSDVEFYDASGNRVVRLQTQTARFVPIMGDVLFFVDRGLRAHDRNGDVLGSVAEIGFGSYGEHRWTEAYSGGSLASTSGRTGIFGMGTRMGEISPTGAYRFFLRNHQGSVIRTIGDNGDYADGASSAKDYLSEGRSRSIKTGTEDVVQTFTGKEFESTAGLYAFGARWMDPDLGAFLTPDPAAEFPDPYSYVGHDPVNRVDPDGLESGDAGGGGQYDYLLGEDGVKSVPTAHYHDVGDFTAAVTSGLEEESFKSQQQAAGGGGPFGAGYGQGAPSGMGGDRSPAQSGSPEGGAPGQGGGPTGGFGDFGLNEPCPDIGWMGTYSSYGGGYFGTVEYMRALGASWMMRGGGTYTLGQGMTSYGKNPGWWLLGYVTSNVSNVPPTTWKEAGFTLAMALPFGMTTKEAALAERMEAQEVIAPTSRAARRAAMRAEGIPTSRSSISQSGSAGTRQYVEMGSDGKPRIITHHSADAKHPNPHWHAAQPKVDPTTGGMIKNRYGQYKYLGDGTVVEH